jgi:hypothetical protein
MCTFDINFIIGFSISLEGRSQSQEHSSSLCETSPDSVPVAHLIWWVFTAFILGCRNSKLTQLLRDSLGT